MLPITVSTPLQQGRQQGLQTDRLEWRSPRLNTERVRWWREHTVDWWRFDMAVKRHISGTRLQLLNLWRYHIRSFLARDLTKELMADQALAL